MSAKDIELLLNKDIKTIEVIYTDILGTFGSKMIPIESFKKNYLNGFGICVTSLGCDIQGELLDGVELFGFENGCPELLIKPILSTFKEVPWKKGYGYVLGDLYYENGDPFKLVPRYILKEIINKFNNLNYRPVVGVELEFYLLDSEKKPLEGGIHCYSHRRALEVENILGEIREKLDGLDIKVEASHVEYGPGQIEIVLEHDDALKIADNATMAKNIIKEVARNNNLYASFMSKPWATESGSGFHIHQSLFDINTNENIFQTNKQIAQYYLAGLTTSLSELMALTSPTINSYKRFTANSFAPVVESWGKDNRTVAIRSLLSDSKSSRFEQRIASSDSNAYLAIAASLAGGLNGILNKLQLEEEENSGYNSTKKRLPNNLKEALDILQESELANKYFGKEFINIFVEFGKHEIKLFSEAITDWEFNRYVEYV